MNVVEDFESRPHKAVTFALSKEERRGMKGTSKYCRRRYLRGHWRKACQEGAQKKKVGKKEDEGMRRKKNHKEPKKIAGINEARMSMQAAENEGKRTLGGQSLVQKLGLLEDSK